jgi:hypothetical protein
MSFPFSFACIPFLANTNTQVLGSSEFWDFKHSNGTAGWTTFQDPVHSFAGSSGTLASNLNQLSARPFFVGALGLQVTALSVTGSGNGVCRVGIYRTSAPSANDVYPTTLVADFGSITTTATNNIWTATNSVFLPNGLYYTAYKLLSGNQTFFYSTPAATDTQILGYSPVNGDAYAALTVTDLTTPMPSTFPAGAIGSLGERCPNVAVNF